MADPHSQPQTARSLRSSPRFHRFLIFVATLIFASIPLVLVFVFGLGVD
ncbi:MAG: hypothetical protein ACFCU4_05410 [Puniceicoccaceae bacterium]